LGFFGALTLNVVSYCRDLQTAHLWPKHAFWHIDRPDQLRNATWARGEESKKKTQRKKKLRDVQDRRCKIFIEMQPFKVEMIQDM